MKEDAIPPTSTVGTVIIGAGTSGLSLAYYLKKKGINPVILEAHRKVALSWRKRHPQLRLNTHRWLSGLPGQPLPAKLGAFVSRDDYIDYLEDYARWLTCRWVIDIRYGAAVQRLARSDEGWLLTTTQGALRARHVIVATGPDRQPYIPSWYGRDTFEGEKRHASDFGDIADYRNKRVLIVGGANSGIDLANHLVRAGHCRSISLSMRQGTHLLPTWLMGVPVQLTAPLLGMLPLKIQDWVAALISRLTIGRLDAWNVRTPEQGVCTRLQESGTAPGFDEGFAAGVRKGLVTVLPEVVRFSENQVEFADHSRGVFDVVVFATGYTAGLQGLLGHLGALDEKGRPKVHAPNADSANPGLWVFGMRPKLEGNIYARKKEARRLAGIIAKTHATRSIQLGTGQSVEGV